MASARNEQINLQRLKSAVLYRIARSGQRVNPLSSYSNRIGSQVQDATDADMAKQYQDGLVSPESYISYLNQKLLRAGLSPSDRVAVVNTIRDTKFGAQETLLTSAYQQAADGTQAKADAASALSKFYADHAAATVPGTPENSNAQSKSAQWASEAQNITDKMGIAERSAARYAKIAEISALPSNDPATATQRATLYQTLADQAMADGQVNEANQWQTKANTEAGNAQTLQTTQTKNSILSEMNHSLDMFKDGKIGAGEILASVTKAESLADQTGDYNLALRIDSVKKSVEDQIKADANKATSSFKKEALHTMDSIELDVANMETAFKYGTDFTPQSDFFKQFIKGSGTPDLNDLVTLKALAYNAEKDIQTQMEDNNIPLPTSRAAAIEANYKDAVANREAFKGGRLLAAIDPATGEVKLEPVQSPEEAAKYYTDQSTGLSFSLINKNSGESAATPDQRFQAVQKGYASPEFYASTGTLAQSGYQINQQRKFLGIDQLMPDVKLNSNIPLYNVSGQKPDTELAVKATDINPKADPNIYYKVNVDTANNKLTITNEKTTPAYSIDPVIVVPYTDAQGSTGLDRIYIKKNPMTGDVTQYYDERRGRLLQAQELSSILRGKTTGDAQTVTPTESTPAGTTPSESTPSAAVAPISPAVSNGPGTNFGNFKLATNIAPSPSYQSGSSFQLPKTPSLTMPGAGVGDLALGKAFEGQAPIQVPAPPSTTGLPTYEQANQRLLSQVNKTPQPSIIDKAKSFISGLKLFK